MIDRLELETLVSEGLSSYQIAARLGKSQSGTMYWIRKYGISLTGDRSKNIPEFKQNCNYCGLLTNNPKYCSVQCQKDFAGAELVSEWLRTGTLKNAAVQSRYVRSFILKDQDGYCTLCPVSQIWEGSKLVLVLDHISGDSSNNVRSNLRLVCPNCDSQLDTYKSKNKGNGRHSRRQRYKEGKSY